MSSVDEQVVELKFNNKEFEANAQQSLGTLDKLKKALHFNKADEGLKKLGEETKQLDFDKVSRQLDGMEKRFSTFGIAGAAAIQRITNAAMDLGKSMMQDVAKPFTAAVSQIKSGGISRAMNLEHANFQLQGLVKNADKVAEIMGAGGPVQNAVDGTAYGLDAAAVAASSLVASGIRAQELEGPLKAIAGVAAMTGREYSDIADIFTTVASNGKLMTMQLRQMSASGLNASAALAKAMGKTEAEINEMVTKGEISFAQFSNAMMEAFGDHAAEANKTFTGSLSNVKAALSRIGAKIATPGLDYLRDFFNEIRPRINTFNDLLGDTSTKGTAIYNINNLFKRFTGFGQLIAKSDGFTRFIVRFANGIAWLTDKVNRFLDFGGPFFNFMSGIGNILKYVFSLIEPIGQAFLDIFPPKTMKELNNIALRFKYFTKTLVANEQTLKNLRAGFRGVFAVIKSVADIVKFAASLIFDFVKALAPVGRVLTATFGTVGDILSNVAYYIELVKTAIEFTFEYFNIFEIVGQVIAGVLSSVINLVNGIAKLVWGVFSSLANNLLSIFGIVLPPIESAGDLIGLIMQGIVVAISVVLSVIDAIADGFNKLASIFTGGADLVSSFNIELDKTSGLFKVLTIPLNAIKVILGAVFQAFYNLLNYIHESGGIFGAITRAFKNLGNVMTSFYGFLKSAFGPIFETIGKGFGFVAGKVKEYTANLTFGKIATAAFIGTMLALAVQIVRLIGGVSSLTYGLGKMAHETGEIIEAFKWRIRPTFIQRFSKVLHEFAYAVLALTAALVILASTPNVDKALINLGLLAGGLLVLTGIMFALSKAMKKAGVTRQMMNLAFTMISIAGAVLILTLALKTLNGIDTDGIIAKAAAIGIMTIALGVAAGLMSKIAPKMTKGAFGLIFFAISVKQIVAAFKDLAMADLKNINENIPVLIAIMGGLALLAVAMGGVKFTSGLGILLVALAIKMLLPVVKDVIASAASIDFSPLAKFIDEYKGALIALGALAVVAAIVIKKISEGFKNFAVGLLGIVAAVYLLAKIAKMIGEMKPEVINRGVTVIAAFMGMIAILMALSYFTKGTKMIAFAAALGMISLVIMSMISIMWLVGKMQQGTIDKGMGVIFKFMLMIAGIMALSKLTEKAQPGKIASMFLALTGAIAVLTTCMYIIGNMDPDVLNTGLSVVTTMTLVLAGFIALSGLSEKAQPAKLGIMFIALAGAILVMTQCIRLLGEMPLPDLLKGAITVAALVALLTGLTIALSKMPNTKNIKKTIVPILGTIALLGSVVLAVKVLGEMPLGDIIQGTVVVAALMLLMTHITKTLSKLPSIRNISKVLTPVLSAIGMLATIVVAMLLLSNLSIEEAIKGVLTILAGMTIMVGAIKILSGIKMSKDMWKPMLASCAMLLSVGIALSMVASYNWGSLLAGSVAMGICLAAVALIIKNVVASTNVEWNQLGKFLLGLASLLIIGVAIKQVAEFSWSSLLAGAVAMNMCLAAYVLLFGIFNTLDVQWSQIGKFALGLASLLIVAKAMAMVLEASSDWKAIVAAAAGMSLAVASVSTVFALFSLIANKINLGAIVNYYAAIGSLLLVAEALSIVVSAGDYQAIEAAGDAILKAVVAIGLVLIELAAATALGAAVIAGLPTMLAALAAVTAVVVAMGAIYKIPFVKELIESGGELLAALGKAIGGFFGGIVNGFATIASQAIPTVGKALADFAVVSKPFWDLLKSFEGTGVIQAAKDIAGVVLILTASSLLNQIADFFSWLTGGNGGFEDLANNLVTFGKGMGEFQRVTKDVKPERMNQIADAALKLGDLLDILHDQKSGGLFGLFTGDTDWKGTLDGLKGFGESMASLCSEMVKVDEPSLNMLAKCAEATKNLVDSMPEKHGAIKGLFASYKDLGKDSEDIKAWAETMGAISTQFSQTPINQQAIDSAVNAGKLISGLANAMPERSGAISGLFSTDKETLKDFSEDMQYFAEGITTFSDYVKGHAIDNAAIRAAADAGTLLTTLANSLPPKDLIKSTGEQVGEYRKNTDLEEFADTLVPFAESMVEFSTKINGIDYTGITKFEPTVKALASIMESTEKLQQGDLTAFANTFVHFGEALKSFGENSDEIDTSKVESFADVLDELLTIFNEKFGANRNKFKGVTEFTKSIATVNDTLKMITSDRQDELKEFGNTLETFSAQFVDFFQGDKGTNKVLKMEVEVFKEKIKILESALMDSGKKKGKQNQNRFKEFKTFADSLSKVADAIVKLSDKTANIDDAKTKISGMMDAIKTLINDTNSIKPKDIKDATKQLNSIGKMVNDFVKKKIDTSGMADVTKQISKAMKSMVKAMGTLKKTSGNETYFDDIASFAMTAGKRFADGLNSNKNTKAIKSACGKFLKNLADQLNIKGGGKAYARYFSDCANNVIAGLKKGLTGQSNMEGIYQAGADVYKKFEKGFKDKGKIKSPSKEMEKNGEYVTQGLLIGMSKDGDKVYDSGYDMGDEIMDGFNTRLGIHSPATALIAAAKNVVAGWMKGIKSGSGKIFESGSSFGGGFLDGLKGALSKIKKGEFSGDSILNSFKKKLNIDKLIKDKDTKKAGNKLSKMFENATKGADTNKKKGGAGGGGKSAASKQAEQDAKDYKKTLTLTLAGLTDIIGAELDKTTKKTMAKAVGYSVDKLNEIIKSYKAQIKTISKDKTFVQSAMRNQAAILAYAKQVKKNNAYITKLNKQLQKSVVTDTKVASKAALKAVGERLGRESAEYKKAAKEYKKNNDKISKNELKALKYLKKIQELNAKYKKASSEKEKKRLKKQLESYSKVVDKLEAKQTELRKKNAEEMKKMTSASTKALKEMKSAVSELVKSWLDFGNFNLDNKGIITTFEGLDQINETGNETVDVFDKITEALNENSDAADNAANKYDALSASMDTGLDLFERFTKTGSVEADALFENADSQLEAFEEFQNGIAQLETMNLDSGVIDQLASEGPQALNKIRGFLSMSKDQIKSYNTRVEKQHEYESKVLERSLRRQFEQYEKYYADLLKLQERFGENFASNSVYRAIEDSGQSSAQFINNLLRLEGSSFTQAVKYFETGLEKVISTATKNAGDSPEVVRAAEKAGKTIWRHLADSMKESNDSKAQFEQLYKDAVEKYGVDADLAKAMYDKGEDFARPFFEGLSEALPEDIKAANDIWKETQIKETTNMLDKVAEDIRNNLKTQNDSLRSIQLEADGSLQQLASTIVERIGREEEMLGKTFNIADYNKVFDSLITSLKNSGMSTSQIFDSLQKWISTDSTEWEKLKSMVLNFKTQTDNNAKITAATVKESWNNNIKTFENNAKNFGQLADKFGDRMSKEFLDYLKGLSPEEIAALNELSSDELKAMADQWYDVNKAATEIENNIYNSLINGSEAALKRWRTYMGSWNGEDTSDAKLNRTLELSQWIFDEKKANKTIKDIIDDYENMNDKVKKELFKYNAENKFADIKNVMASLKELYDQGLPEEEIIAKLQEGGNVVTKYAGWREQFLGDALSSGDAVKNVLSETFENAFKQTEADLKNPDSSISKSLGTLSATANSVFEEIIGGASGKKKKNKKDKNKKNALTESLTETVKEAKEQTQSTFTKTGETLGKKTSTGVMSGVKSKQKNVTSTVKNVSNTTKNQSTNTYQNDGYWLGDAMVTGLANGIYDGRSRAISAAVSVAVAAYQAAKAAIDSNSPSKKFMQLGEWSTEGFAIGMLNNEYLVTSAMTSIADSTLTGMRDAISKVNDAINGDLELSPVITPQLDLSLLNRQVQSTGHLFDARVKLAEDERSKQEAQNQNEGNMTFVQNNYSPKALSREEIYRQTKNQFAIARKAVGIQ